MDKKSILSDALLDLARPQPVAIQIGMKMHAHCDVLIVGAGPAAWRLHLRQAKQAPGSLLQMTSSFGGSLNMDTDCYINDKPR